MRAMPLAIADAAAAAAAALTCRSGTATPRLTRIGGLSPPVDPPAAADEASDVDDGVVNDPDVDRVVTDDGAVLGARLMFVAIANGVADAGGDAGNDPDPEG
jgi:hypothetical protein